MPAPAARAAARAATSGFAAVLLACAAPPARAGALRVCASDLVDFDDAPAIALPAGLVFVEWGPADRDLRALRLDPDYPEAGGAGGRAAVALAAPATLTAADPCATVDARAVLSPRRAWTAPVVLPGASAFLALDTLGPDGPRAPAGEDHALREALATNALAARPVSPVADAETVP